MLFPLLVHPHLIPHLLSCFGMPCLLPPPLFKFLYNGLKDMPTMAVIRELILMRNSLPLTQLLTLLYLKIGTFQLTLREVLRGLSPDSSIIFNWSPRAACTPAVVSAPPFIPRSKRATRQDYSSVPFYDTSTETLDLSMLTPLIWLNPRARNPVLLQQLS